MSSDVKSLVDHPTCPTCGSIDRAHRVELCDGASHWPCPDDAWHGAQDSVAFSNRDYRIAAFETIGCALAVLRRLDHIRYDADIRETLMHVRSTLSVAQSKIKERIDG